MNCRLYLEEILDHIFEILCRVDSKSIAQSREQYVLTYDQLGSTSLGPYLQGKINMCMLIHDSINFATTDT